MSSVYVFIMENSGKILIAKVLLQEINLMTKSAIFRAEVSEQYEKNPII